MAKKEVTVKDVPTNNPYIKAKSSDGHKVYSWVCRNNKPAEVCASTLNGPEYVLNLKSLLAALKANKLI